MRNADSCRSGGVTSRPDAVATDRRRARAGGLPARAWLLAGLVGTWAAPPPLAGFAGEAAGVSVAAEQSAPAASGTPCRDHRRRALEPPPGGGPLRVSPGAPLVVAWFGPSDPGDAVTGDLWQAAKLAFDEANAATSGRPLELRPCWAKNPWGTGVAKLFHLVYHEPVVAVLGSVDGPATHLAEQVVAKAQLPLVSPVSSDASVNFAGVPWMFSCAPPDSAFAPVLAAEIARELRSGGEGLALVNATDHDSRQTARALLSALAERGLTPDRQLEFTPGGDTFEVQLRALGDFRPAVLLLLAGAEDSARFLRGVRRRDLHPVVFGAPAMGRRAFRKQAGPVAEGVRFPWLAVATPETRAALQRFQAAFQARAGHPADYAARQTYDAARLLIAAIRRGGADRRAVCEALRALSPWPGVAGEIAFDGLGRNLRPVTHLATIRKGVVIPLTRSDGSQTDLSAPPGKSPRPSRPGALHFVRKTTGH